MIERAGPTLRRVASSTTTIISVPMIQSSGSGLPTRNCKSWNTQGTYRLRARAGDRQQPVLQVDA